VPRTNNKSPLRYLAGSEAPMINGCKAPWKKMTRCRERTRELVEVEILVKPEAYQEPVRRWCMRDAGSGD